MRLTRFFALSWILLLFLRPGAAAQEQPLRFQHLSIDDGLSQNTVYCLLQDRKGFIWIGTGDGLNKFDGYRFTVFHHDSQDDRSLSDNQVNALFEDSEGNLWVGTGGGLNRFDRESQSFVRYHWPGGNSPSRDYITSFAESPGGQLWAGTYDGLAGLDTGGKASLLPRLQAPGRNKIQCLFSNSERDLWIGINDSLRRYDPLQDAFLPLPACLAGEKTLQGSQVRSIKKDEKGRVWIGTEHAGLFCFDPRNNTCRRWGKNEGLPSNTVRDVFPLSANQVWIGTREGLSILDLQTGQLSSYVYNKYDPSGLSHNSVRDIMQDRAGSIWIGTFSGGVNVCHRNSNNFSRIGEQFGSMKGLNYPVVSSVVADGNKGLWIGTEGGGLNYLDRESGRYRYFTTGNTGGGLPHDNIKSLSPDAEGNLWIGTYHGLSCFNTRTGAFRNFRGNENAPPAIAASQIHAVLACDSGVWVGTNGQGLAFLDRKGQVQTWNYHSGSSAGPASDNIMALLADASGALWIGTTRGLSRFDQQRRRFTHYDFKPGKKHSLSNNSVLALFIDSRGRLWIGTEGGGLNMLDPSSGRFYAYGEKEGLANNVVHAIRQDREGNLWISTNKGLSQASFPAGGTGREPSGTGHAGRESGTQKPGGGPPQLTFSNYTAADGLQGNQFSTGAAGRTPGGTLFFGGINGVTVFRPEAIFHNPFIPPVVFTGLLIKNKPAEIGKEDAILTRHISETERIVLPYSQAFLTFEFAALNFISPEKNEYAYRLEGFRQEEQWNYIGNQRSATYTNLDAGRYVFRVIASNNDGIWNREGASIEVIVLPPWWKTWWAYCIYALIIGSLLYLFHYYSYKTARLKSDLLFEHRSREQEQELARRKMRFFTNISHEIKTPLTLILAPIERLISLNEGNNKVHNQLMLMQRNGERLIRLINQLLDFRKFESGSVRLSAAEGDLTAFTREVALSFGEYARQKQVQLNFTAPPGPLMLWFDHDKMEKVLFNLLSNAVKFTPPGGRIRVRTSLAPAKAGALPAASGEGPSGSFAVIEVEDNGPGIPAGNLSRIFERYHHFGPPRQETGGTGIGLAFSKGLVELHRGTISVTSTPAEGGKQGFTCFSVALPVGCMHLEENEMVRDLRDSEHIRSYLEEELPPGEYTVKKKKQVLEGMEKERPLLLVAEDNPEVLNLLASCFTADFTVRTATGGADAWRAALEELPDIIISDVMMPGMSGTGLCSRLKSDPRTSHIPVILLTARTPLIFKIEGLETGADDYITKPFSPRFLEARVWNLLESRQKLRERFQKEIRLQPENIAITSPDEKFLRKAISFIEDHMMETALNVEQMGKEVGMSRVTLYRKIKALTGQTAVEFIRSIRLKRAAQLLGEKKLQVNEVAYLTGFQDTDYFRKCFKEQFGHTPREYAATGVNRRAAGPAERPRKAD